MYMTVKHKHYILEEERIKRAQELLGTKNETETIERALAEVITERERSQKAWKVQDRFLWSKIQMIDVYGRVE